MSSAPASAPASSGSGFPPGKNPEKVPAAKKSWKTKAKAKVKSDTGKMAQGATYTHVPNLGVTLIEITGFAEMEAAKAVFGSTENPNNAEFLVETGIQPGFLLRRAEPHTENHMKNPRGYPRRLVAFTLLGEDNHLITEAACKNYHVETLIEELKDKLGLTYVPPFVAFETIERIGTIATIQDLMTFVRRIEEEPSPLPVLKANIYRYYEVGHVPRLAYTKCNMTRDQLDQADVTNFVANGWLQPAVIAQPVIQVQGPPLLQNQAPNQQVPLGNGVAPGIPPSNVANGLVDPNLAVLPGNNGIAPGHGINNVAHNIENNNVARASNGQNGDVNDTGYTDPDTGEFIKWEDLDLDQEQGNVVSQASQGSQGH